jgi:hypothetical protein
MIRDLRALEGLTGLPEGVELGIGHRDSGQSIVVVASVRDGLDLPGWGEVALSLTNDAATPKDVIIAAPLLSERTRRAVHRASLLGRSYCLAVIPGLASPDAGILDQERFPRASQEQSWLGGPGSLLDRVLRVASGAAAVASCGELRGERDVFLLYMRGVCVLRVCPEGEGVAVTFMFPDTKLVHITESNFARWGVELHETVLNVAQDPRLLEGEGAERERVVEPLAAELGVRVTTRWLSWNREGIAPIEWVGIDTDGRPVLGVVRAAIALSDGPALLAGLHLLEEERERWAPASFGAPRLRIASDRVDPKLSTLLSDSGVDFEVRSLAATTEEANERQREGERRGRRRPRRRRRSRAETTGWQRGEESEALEEQHESAEAEDTGAGVTPEGSAEDGERRSSSRRGRSRGVRARSETREERPVEETDDTEVPIGEASVTAETAAEEPVSEDGVSEEETSRVPPTEDEPPIATTVSGDQEAFEFALDERVRDADDLVPSTEPVTSDPVEIEIEATLAEEPEDEEEAEDESTVTEPTRRRSARAAIVVCNDTEAILSAFILARDRRNTVSFRVVPQDGLMDFFKGPATDLGENVDLLLVGFTAQPTPVEIINTAEIFRGRLQWFDHHEWPIEDVERLRDAIGRDAIVFTPGASSPLAAISQVTERRSRFTDKLIDLAGGRLSENEMTKWGYRVVGFLNRLAAEPGEHRAEITPILSGKPGTFPESESVYAEEEAWLQEHDPRVVNFGEYKMVVLRVPSNLDAGEMGRRSRLSTGARLSLTSREDDDLVMLGCNDEKRHISLSVLVEHVSEQVPWAENAQGGTRAGYLRIQDLSQHPERIEALVGQIVRNRSILYG